MGRAMGLGAMVLVGAIGWKVAGSIGSEALAMAVGVLFGILAGIPTALLMLAASRRQPEALPPPPQVTIINHYHAAPAQPQLPAPAPTDATGCPPGAGTALKQMPGYHAWWETDGKSVHVVKVSTGQAWTVPGAVYQAMAANPPRLLTDQGRGPTANLQ